MIIKSNNHDRRLVPIHNPSIFWPTLLAILVYLPPYIFSVFYDGKVLKAFVPVSYSEKLISLAFILLCSVILLLITSIHPKIEINIKTRKIKKSHHAFIAFAYLVLGIFSIIDLYATLDFKERFIIPLLNRDIGRAILGINIIGGDIAKSGAARAFLFLQVSVVASILYSDSKIKYMSIIFKKLLLAFAVIGSIVLCLMARREAIIFVFLVLFYCTQIKSQADYNIRRVSLLILSLLLVLIVMIRIGSYDISSYINSQEFYPIQYGAYLIGDDIAGNSRYDLQNYDITKLSFTQVLTHASTLSGMESFRRFGLIGYGPTVSIFYTLYSFWLFPFILIILFSLVFNSIFTKEAIKNQRIRLLYIYICIKWFFLIRNGEVPLFTWDVIIFLILLIPMFILNPIQKQKGEMK